MKEDQTIELHKFIRLFKILSRNKS